jgi:hypothetical protein
MKRSLEAGAVEPLGSARRPPLAVGGISHPVTATDRRSDEGSAQIAGLGPHGETEAWQAFAAVTRGVIAELPFGAIGAHPAGRRERITRAIVLSRDSRMQTFTL